MLVLNIFIKGPNKILNYFLNQTGKISFGLDIV